MASVLICDDEPVITELLSVTLEAQGYLVPMAANGRQALQLAGLHRPDLVILDMELPDMNGLEILQQLRLIDGMAHTPVLFLTGVEDPEVVACAKSLGAVGYLTKRAMSGQNLLRTIAQHVPRDADALPTRSSSSRLGMPDPFDTALASTRIQTPGEHALCQVGGWQLIDKIGRGSMGDVYLAIRGDDRAALKVMPRWLEDNQQMQWRFAREIEVLRRLDHPSIVELLDAGDHDGHPYLAMRYVHAPDLKHYLRLLPGEVMESAEAWALIGQLASALRSAWDAGIVHRDIKPSNILMDEAGGRREPFRAILCDFGLAHLQHQFAAEMDESTVAGMILGTPAYMSPEQASGQHPTDQRQDIYCLGATVFRAVTGLLPFSGGEMTTLKRRIYDDVDLAPLDDIGDMHLGTLIAEMMARQPEQRIQTWDEVLARAAAGGHST